MARSLTSIDLEAIHLPSPTISSASSQLPSPLLSSEPDYAAPPWDPKASDSIIDFKRIRRSPWWCEPVQSSGR